MPRVFTTSFDFNGHTYKAIIVVKDRTAELKIGVRVFDEKLISILGNDSIEFVGLTGFRHNKQWQHPAAQAMLEEISKAIVAHLLQ